METGLKIADFESLLVDFKEPYEKVKQALTKLKTCETFNEVFPEFIELNDAQWEQFQSDWIRITAKLTREEDIEFVRQSFMPLTYNLYEYYVDLSDPKLTVFGIAYAHQKTSGWFKYLLFENLEELIQSDLEQVEFATLKQHCQVNFSEGFAKYF
ncbi:MAG: hypothetical protein R2850_05610 [Bacteroidia bacterium]